MCVPLIHRRVVIGDQLLVFGRQVRFERGLGFIQFYIGEGGQERADHDHIQQATVTGLFGDLVAGNKEGDDVGALGGAVDHGLVDHQHAARLDECFVFIMLCLPKFLAWHESLPPPPRGPQVSAFALPPLGGKAEMGLRVFYPQNPLPLRKSASLKQ
jgi:hypothetical protein